MGAEVRIRLPEGKAAHYARVEVRLWSENTTAWPTSGFSGLRLLRIAKGAHVAETRASGASRFNIDDISGLPVVVDDRFFAGVEHPMASSALDPGGDYVGQVSFLSRLQRPTKDKPWSYGLVLGAISEPSQARRAFVEYIHAERPGRRTPMVHYNSWYDFYSYQDEGFNGGFKDPVSDPVLIASLRPDRLNETNCLQRVHAFGKHLVEKRGAKIDSFLWDDGWDNSKSLWQFDTERFPHRFDEVAAGARKFGAGTGVWLSPWGGYGFPQEERVAFGKEHGWETNYNVNIDTEAFSLAGENYRKAFGDVALAFVKEQGVNMFKFDGVAGDPEELAQEMEAMLSLITDLRAATAGATGVGGAPRALAGGGGGDASSAVAPAKSGSSKNSDDDIWINLTTGTWGSPFFLLWADSIWRGGPDIASSPRDWRPDNGAARDGLSKRQRWIRWRNVIVYALVVSRSSFFPISQLMIHGVVVASHGDALHWGLDTYDAVDFAQEVWSFVGLGLQLQELYVAPRHMKAKAWDSLAEGLKWSRRHAAVLRDSHWSFGDPTRREVTGVASWSVADGYGFLFLHNPTGLPGLTRKFSLSSALELPGAQASAQLQVGIVKSIYRAYDDRDEAPQTGPTALSNAAADVGPRLLGWTCDRLPLWPPEGPRQPAAARSAPGAAAAGATGGAAGTGGAGGCALAAETSVQVELRPTEVLVLAVELVPGAADVAGEAAPRGGVAAEGAGKPAAKVAV